MQTRMAEISAISNVDVVIFLKTRGNFEMSANDRKKNKISMTTFHEFICLRLEVILVV